MSAPNHGERADARKRRTEAQQALADTIAATLAEHRRTTASGACSCGQGEGKFRDSDVGRRYHRVHVATILAEQEAQRFDAERVRHGHPSRTGAHQ